MKILLASTVLAVTLAAGTVPASAQRIGIGIDGPSIDLRSRGDRQRDYRRVEMRRDRGYDRRLSRGDRFDDDRRGSRSRGYGY